MYTDQQIGCAKRRAQSALSNTEGAALTRRLGADVCVLAREVEADRATFADIRAALRAAASHVAPPEPGGEVLAVVDLCERQAALQGDYRQLAEAARALADALHFALVRARRIDERGAPVTLSEVRTIIEGAYAAYNDVVGLTLSVGPDAEPRAALRAVREELKHGVHGTPVVLTPEGLPPGYSPDAASAAGLRLRGAPLAGGHAEACE